MNFQVHYVSLFLVYLSVPKRRRHDSRGVLVVLLLLQSSHVISHLASLLLSSQNLYLFHFDTHPRNYPCPLRCLGTDPHIIPSPTSALPTSSQTNPQQTHFSPDALSRRILLHIACWSGRCRYLPRRIASAISDRQHQQDSTVVCSAPGKVESWMSSCGLNPGCVAG